MVRLKFVNDNRGVYRQSIDRLVNVKSYVGAKRADYNPQARSYIIGFRNGLAIIDMRLTLFSLRRALLFFNYAIARRSHVLFILNMRNYATLAFKATLHAASVTGVWKGGTLTNNLNIFSCLVEDFADSANFLTYPDVAVLLESDEKYSYIFNEARLTRTPLFSLMDSDMAVERSIYGIPSNNDAFGTLSYYYNVILSLIRKTKYRQRVEFSILYCKALLQFRKTIKAQIKLSSFSSIPFQKILLPVVGLEPTSPLGRPDFKSGASTNFRQTGLLGTPIKSNLLFSIFKSSGRFFSKSIAYLSSYTRWRSIKSRIWINSVMVAQNSRQLLRKRRFISRFSTSYMKRNKGFKKSLPSNKFVNNKFKRTVSGRSNNKSGNFNRFNKPTKFRTV